jgi:hypothetical protein
MASWSFGFDARLDALAPEQPEELVVLSPAAASAVGLVEVASGFAVLASGFAEVASGLVPPPSGCPPVDE